MATEGNRIWEKSLTWREDTKREYINETDDDKWNFWISKLIGKQAAGKETDSLQLMATSSNFNYTMMTPIKQ